MGETEDRRGRVVPSPPWETPVKILLGATPLAVPRQDSKESRRAKGEDMAQKILLLVGNFVEDYEVTVPF